MKAAAAFKPAKAPVADCSTNHNCGLAGSGALGAALSVAVAVTYSVTGQRPASEASVAYKHANDLGLYGLQIHSNRLTEFGDLSTAHQAYHILSYLTLRQWTVNNSVKWRGSVRSVCYLFKVPSCGDTLGTKQRSFLCR